MYVIYLLLSSTIICIKGAVNRSSNTSSGESGTGTVGPTADWNGVMVTDCRLVVHIAVRVPGGGVVEGVPTGEQPGGGVVAGELAGGECGLPISS